MMALRSSSVRLNWNALASLDSSTCIAFAMLPMKFCMEAVSALLRPASIWAAACVMTCVIAACRYWLTALVIAVVRASATLSW